MAAVSAMHEPMGIELFDSPSKLLLDGLKPEAFFEKYNFVIALFKDMEIRGIVAEQAEQTDCFAAPKSGPQPNYKEPFISATASEARTLAFKMLFKKCADYSKFPIKENVKLRVSGNVLNRVRQIFSEAAAKQDDESKKLQMNTFAEYPNFVFRVGTLFLNAVVRRRENDLKYPELIKEICPEGKLSYTYWNEIENLDVPAKLKDAAENPDFTLSFQSACDVLNHSFMKLQGTGAKLDVDRMAEVKKAFEAATLKCPDVAKRTLIGSLINDNFDYLSEHCSKYVSTLSTYNCTVSWLRTFSPF